MPLPEETLRQRDSRRDLGQELLESVRQMKGGKEGQVHCVETSSVVTARLRMKLSQQDFAALLGVSVRTLQDWEQGRRKPTGAAKTLIAIAENHPEVLLELVGR